jgi:hypothetical protein
MSLLYARQIGNESDGQHQEGMDEKKVANGMSPVRVGQKAKAREVGHT